MEAKVRYAAPLILTLLFCTNSVQAEPALQKTSYRSYSSKKVEGPLELKRAKKLIQEYYNQHSMWSRYYKMDAVKRIRFEHHGPKRVLAHVEYSYHPLSDAKDSFVQGTDRRVFLLIKKQAWLVISMGQHMSARFQ